MVVPDHGTFPELISRSGGGVLYRADDVEALAGSLADLLQHPEKAVELGRRGKESVGQNFTAQSMAQRHIELYRHISGQVAA